MERETRIEIKVWIRVSFESVKRILNRVWNKKWIEA
jgi:hypothetical protein